MNGSTVEWSLISYHHDTGPRLQHKNSYHHKNKKIPYENSTKLIHLVKNQVGYIKQTYTAMKYIASKP